VKVRIAVQSVEVTLDSGEAMEIEIAGAMRRLSPSGTVQVSL
jgi:hypothetical protein